MLRYIKFLLLFFLLFIQVYVYSQSLKRATLPYNTLSEVYPVIGGNITIFIDKETGKYFLKTINDKSIFYNDPTRPDFFTSHMNVKVDDSVYSNEAMVAKNCLTNTLATEAVVIWGDKGPIFSGLAEYKIKNNKITVTQKLLPAQYYNMGFVIIEINIKNNDTIPHDIGILLEFDWQINKSNKDNFKTNTEIITNEMLFTSNSIPFLWRAYESFQSSDLIIQNFLKGNFYFTTGPQDKIEVSITPPDVFVLGEWEKLFNVIWDYQPQENSPIIDGASLMRWNEKPVLPNSEVTYYTCIGETKGTIRDGQIIINNLSVDKIEYDGIRYRPDTLKSYTIIYNDSDEKVENIYSSVELPYNLVSNSLTRKSVPETLYPDSTGIITHLFVPKPTEILQTEQVTENIFSSLEDFSINYTIDIPAAPDADTLSPDILFSSNGCSFEISISENRTNDKGIDSVIIESNNVLYNIRPFKKGDILVTISGGLHKPDSLGSIKVKVFDRAGNYEEKLFEINPILYGFNDENMQIGYTIYLPFKKKSNQFDTLVFCKIKFDSTILKPDHVPLLQQINFIDKIKVTVLEQTANELSFSLYKKDGLPTSTLALIHFIHLVDNDLPTTVTIEELVVNDEPNNCTQSYSSNISFQSKDKFHPYIMSKHFGCRLFFTIVEKDIDDKGIYYVYLSNESNTTVIMDDFEPGARELNVIIACTDSLQPARGNLNVIDGSGKGVDFYYEITPVLIKMDTIISKFKQPVIFTPKIYGNFYDRTHYEYNFSISYDTTVLTCIAPYFDLSNTSSVNYNVNCDISTKGKVVVTASGGTPLIIGNIINLLFDVNVGKDTVSTIRFDYFYLKRGITPVHTTDGVIIRHNNDTIAPVISYVKKRNNVYLAVTENDELDVGINKVEFLEKSNFLINPDSTSIQKNSYTIIPIDSTETSSCKVVAIDFVGNLSSESIMLNPIKIFMPKEIYIDNDSFTLPIYIRSKESFSLNSLNFKIKLDTQKFVFLDTLDFHSDYFKKIQLKYDKNSQCISVFINETLFCDTVSIELLNIALYIKPNLTVAPEIGILDIVINNDSLYAFSNKTLILRENRLPQILISKNSCEYDIKIFDERGIDKIELKQLNNIIDSIQFLVPFNRYDTVAFFKVYPINYKQPSSFMILASNLMGNMLLEKTSLTPVKVSLPNDIVIHYSMINEIPLLIDRINVPINNISMVIKYDERMLTENSYFTSAGTLLENSNIKYQHISPNMIEIRADNIKKRNLDTLLKLNVMGKTSDMLYVPIFINSLSINNNVICSFGESAFLQNYVDTIYCSIQALSAEYIGKEINIPIFLNNFHELHNYIFNEIKFYISFNPDMLKPISVSQISGTTNEFESKFSYDQSSGKLVITFSSNNQIDLSDLYFSSFTAKVLLSNLDSTAIILDSVSVNYINDIVKPVIVLTSGVFYTKRFEWLEELFIKENYLFQNHPNPYNLSTVIRFNIKNKSKTELTIYDITGRVVSKPVNSILDRGEYQISFDASMLTSGVYFYQLKTERYNKIKKMVLLK